MSVSELLVSDFFFFQAEDGIRDLTVTGVQTCALPILLWVTSTPAGCILLRRLRSPIGLGESSNVEHHYNWRNEDRKSTRLNSSHSQISYAVFCLKKKIVGRCYAHPTRLDVDGGVVRTH